MAPTLCVPPGVSALGHKDKCSVITHQWKQGNFWLKNTILSANNVYTEMDLCTRPSSEGTTARFSRVFGKPFPDKLGKYCEGRPRTPLSPYSQPRDESPLFWQAPHNSHLLVGRRLVMMISCSGNKAASRFYCRQTASTQTVELCKECSHISAAFIDLRHQT